MPESVLAWNRIKEAALYYDQVFALIETPKTDQDVYDLMCRDELFHPEGNWWSGTYDDFQEGWFSWGYEHVHLEYWARSWVKKNTPYKNRAELLADLYQRGTAAYALPSKELSTYLKNPSGQLWGTPSGLSCSYTNPMFVMSGIKLVDMEKVSWDLIFELHRDAESKTKLMRLRRFFRKNFAGTERNVVEDELNLALEDYHETAKSWACPLTDHVLSALIDCKGVYASAGASLAFLLCGAPWTAVVASSTPAIVDLASKFGKIMIKIRADNRSLNAYRKQHDLAYLVEVIERTST